MKRLNITPELFKEVFAYYARAPREEQRFDAEDALRLAVGIGEQMCPHFAIDTYNEAAYTNIARWLVGDPAMEAEKEDGKPCRGSLLKGIYLQGSVGVGKTLCLDIFAIVAKYLKLEYDGEPLAWQSVRTDAIALSFQMTGETLYDAGKVVCFQDLGVEPSEVLYMGNRRNVMRGILERRGDNLRQLTLITSNVPIAKIGDYYGERVHSRLLQMCNILTIGGSDRRQTL